MNVERLKTLFLTSNGRIGKKDFWLGFVILIVAGMILGMVPLVGTLISVLLIYPWVCIYAKRLHDFDKTGWLVLVPVVVGVVGTILAVLMGFGGMLGAGAVGDEAASAAAMGGLGAALAILGLVCLIHLGFLLWVGLADGTPGPNKYGPPVTNPTPTD